MVAEPVPSAQPARTPSLALGIQPIPRLPPFTYNADNLPLEWFGGDPGRTAVWNSLSVLAEVGEARFIRTGRWLLDRITCPAAAEETARFIQQEASHSAVHRRFNRVLKEQGRPVPETRRLAEMLFDWIAEHAGHEMVVAVSLAGEQAVGELGHATLEHPAHLDCAHADVRQMWLWHWYEEVEHQAALHDGFTHVMGMGRRGQALRVLGALYAIVYVGVVWPATSVAMARSGGARNSLRTWRPVLRQMFGRNGLLVGTVRNLWALPRRDFHPFSVHDPRPALQEWDGTAVKAEWAQKVRLPGRHGGRADEALPQVSARTVWTAVRFVGVAVMAALRFLWETRRRDETRAEPG